MARLVGRSPAPRVAVVTESSMDNGVTAKQLPVCMLGVQAIEVVPGEVFRILRVLFEARGLPPGRRQP